MHVFCNVFATNAINKCESESCNFSKVETIETPLDFGFFTALFLFFVPLPLK